MASYRVAAPDEYLAITGMGVKNVKITKSAWVFPFQRVMRFSVQPHDYSMNLQAMTKEKLQFMLPVVFTVGPDINHRGANSKFRSGSDNGENLQQSPHHDEDDEHIDATHREDRGDALMKYAMLLAESDGSKKKPDNDHLGNIVRGIIEGEVRVLVSSMTMEEIFTEREVFKKRIYRNIQTELDKLGLKIWNANVKELKDAKDSRYFESLSKKAHEGATSQARIDVAEARLKGDVGESERQGQQEREIAKIHAETAVQKTERDIERAEAEARLATRRTAFDRDVEIARIEASRSTEAKDEDLKRDVAVKRAQAEMERLRATDVVKAQIQRESKQQAADAVAYEISAQAKADYEKSKQATDAYAYKTKLDAAAQAEAEIQKADATMVKQLKEAEGLTAMAGAYAKLSEAFGGPQGLLQYMMIENGTYVELAKANAAGIQGLQPKISVWNTGAQGGGAAGGADAGRGSQVDTMRNIYQMLPPLMETIHDQTGITLPEWQFGRMAGEMSQVERGKMANGAK
ncbi:hypothetical protein GE09DRAFT_1074043 [Coniochaeta sp. 2T2.1]|nr:hypothetical protein GE09DRAFT_1074043 [Coniochaeta sp. 2T2.1]